MIPPFDPATGNLPPGVHEATWDEIQAYYGYNQRRVWLLAGLKAALDALEVAGCRRAYLNGSFVTAKELPGDFDGCWEVASVDVNLLDPVLLDFANLRAAQRAKYQGELFPAHIPADLFGTPFLEFFQRDRRTGSPKGIVAIDLGGVP